MAEVASLVREVSADERPAVSIRHVSKRFGATVALDDVSVDFWKGEVHCLLGENGAGKSTVGKILAGLFPADRGDLRIDDVPTSFVQISEARARGVAMVFQELSLAPHLTVRENIFLGAERRSLFRLVEANQETDVCKRLMQKYGIEIDPDAQVGALTVAEQQLVEVLKALAQSPSVIIFDEPTSMLGIHEKPVLFKIIRQARDNGAAIMFVTHHVDEVVELADRVSLLKNGQLLETFRVDNHLNADDVLAKLSEKVIEEKSKRSVARNECVLEIKDVPTISGDLADIRVHRGEIVGIYGIVGCGREHLAEELVGLKRNRKRNILLNRQPYAARNPAEARRRGVVYLPSGRAANLILPNRSIRENLSVSQLASFSKKGLLELRRELIWVKEKLTMFATKYSHHNEPIVALSGGNQQKVLMARVLSEKASLAVLEDPTVGVDVDTKHQIHETLLKYSEENGLGILLLSSDLLESIKVCDTIYAMYQGKIVDRWYAPSRENEGAIVTAILGGKG